MKIINTPPIDPALKRDALDFVSNVVSIPSSITLEGIFLGGSHTKGTSNKDSDIDLLIYYAHSLSSLLQVDSSSLVIDSSKTEMRDGSGTCFYNYNTRDYELSFVPIFTSTETKKELVRSLYRQKIDYLFKFVKSEPLFISSVGAPYSASLKHLRDTIINDYHWDRDAVFGYFHGYMLSQLQRHKRRRDGERRMLESLSKNSALPIVKLTIDGLYICLSGISILEDETIILDFWELYHKYHKLFTSDQRKFIASCYDRKRCRTSIEMDVSDWTSLALNHRDDLFTILNNRIHISRESSTLPSLTRSLRRDNAKMLNKYLYDLYEIECLK